MAETRRYRMRPHHPRWGIQSEPFSAEYLAALQLAGRKPKKKGCHCGVPLADQWSRYCTLVSLLLTRSSALIRRATAQGRLTRYRHKDHRKPCDRRLSPLSWPLRFGAPRADLVAKALTVAVLETLTPDHIFAASHGRRTGLGAEEKIADGWNQFLLAADRRDHRPRDDWAGARIAGRGVGSPVVSFTRNAGLTTWLARQIPQSLEESMHSGCGIGAVVARSAGDNGLGRSG